MTPNQMNRGLEDRLSGLLASMAVTNEGVMNLTKIAEKHETLLYGKDDEGGLVTRGNVVRQTLADHEATLQRLETSCQQVVNFMEAQIEVNKSQTNVIANMNKVIYTLAGTVFLILLLIGVADISALHNLLAGIKIP